MDYTNCSAPVVTYTSIKLGSADVTLGNNFKASFVAPYNKLVVKFKSDVSLSSWMARVTKMNDDYDIDLGVKAAGDINLAANTEYTKEIDINNINFSEGDGNYRISLYSQSSISHEWDVYYIFTTIGYIFKTADNEEFNVLSDRMLT